MSAYKDEERGTWYVKFSYVDWKGNTRWTTKRGFKGKRAAEKYEREFKDKAAETPDMTVSTLVDAYLADIKLHVRPTTYVSRSCRIKKYVLPALGNIKLSELTPLKMRQWQNELARTPAGRKGTYLASATIHIIRCEFSAVLNYAVRFYGLRDNPLRQAGTCQRAKKGTVDERHIWEPSDFYKAMEHEKRTDLRHLFYLLFFGGFRIGEVLSLEASDFDFLTNVVHVTKTLSPITHEPAPTKTPSSVRDVTIPTPIMQAIRKYISRLEPVPSPLFSCSYGCVLEHLRNAAAAAGVPIIRIHDLRHSHASYLINRGVPITSVSHRLGHKNASVTLGIYSHFYKSSDKDIAEMISKEMSNS